MNAQTDITSDLTMVALADLTISPLNTRQTVADADIDAMADSIAVSGLMQNLLAFRTPQGGIEVVAGGKRLRALQRLAAHPERNTDQQQIDTIPVRITEDEAQALEWAGAENEARTDPHPADQIRAYRDMQTAGHDAAQIARAYARTESHVRGRLRLAQLPETALTALKEGQINLDEAKALTMADDPAQLDRVLENTMRNPHYGAAYIRRELQDGKISASDRRVVFLGLDTYVAEGGALTQDLFEGESLLHDEALLQRLFETKLKLKAEQAQTDEGWAWATPITESHLPYDRYTHLQRLFSTPGELSDGDVEEYDRLADLANADAINDQDLARLEELQDRLDGDYTDEDRATGGIFVYVNYHGELHVDRAYAARNQSGDAGETTPGEEPPKETKPKPPITAAGMEDLHVIATLALQTAMLDKYELMIDILAFQLESDMYNWAAPFNISVTPQRIEPSQQDEVTISAKLTAGTEVTGPTPAEQFAAFRALGRAHRNSVLARHLARSMNAPFQSDFGKALFAATDCSLRKVWTPTAANFFSRCSVPMLDGLWAELLALEDDDPRHAEFGKLKKSEKAVELEALIMDASVQEAHGLSRDQVKEIDAWVPDEFRAPDLQS